MLAYSMALVAHCLATKQVMIETNQMAEQLPKTAIGMVVLAISIAEVPPIVVHGLRNNSKKRLFRKAQTLFCFAEFLQKRLL